MLLFVVIFLVMLGWGITIYNRLIRLIEAVNNNQSQIDIQLDQRYKVYESLISAVKQYMDYEQTVLAEVVKLRSQADAAKAAQNKEERIRAEEAISAIGSGIKVAFERYPELKANQNILQLQETIVNVENKLAFAKQAYNDSIERYEAMRKQLLESIVAKFFADKLIKQFAYWRVADQVRAEHEAYTVKF